MVKNGAKSASNVQAGTFGELDSQDHDLPQQRYDRPGLVSENGPSEKTYYYSQRRLLQALSEQQVSHKTAFAEVTPPQPVCSGNVAVTVRISGAEADIHAGADAAIVETVLRILKSC